MDPCAAVLAGLAQAAGTGMRAYLRWVMGPDGGLAMLTIIGAAQLLACVCGKLMQ